MQNTRKQNKWSNKNAIVLGDSLTATGVWQQKLNTQLNMNVTTHALGGIGLATTVEGTESKENPNDQLHLNTSIGYQYLGECIASFIDSI